MATRKRRELGFHVNAKIGVTMVTRKRREQRWDRKHWEKTVPMPKRFSGTNSVRKNISKVVPRFVHRMVRRRNFVVVHLFSRFASSLLISLFSARKTGSSLSRRHRHRCSFSCLGRRHHHRRGRRRLSGPGDWLFDSLLLKVILMRIFQPLWKRSPPLNRW